MQRNIRAWGLAVLLLTGLYTLACGNAEEKAAAAADAAQTERWAEIQQTQQELDAKRAELEAARQAEEAAGEAADGEAAAAPAGNTIPQLESEVQQLADEFNNGLVSFINENPPVAGESMSEAQLSAIRMKSAEDILYAREYIERGGDYGRAIDIYKAALIVDPENPDLQQALARAESDRYMTAERFAAVKKGMSGEEVSQAIGAPYYRNVRDFPGDVVAWFYPTDPQRSAAAVWFRKLGDGTLEVYKANFEEVVKGGEPDEAAEGAGRSS